MGQKLQYRKPYLNLFKTLLANEENETKKVIPTILQHVLQEFQDVKHDEISPSLPPLQEIHLSS
jgi:hypothetical protein